MNKRKMSKSILLYFFMLIFIISYGCSSSSKHSGEATVTGEVSGTTIVAVNEDDEEIARVTASGTPKTFTMIVPSGHTYRIYLIENEGTVNETIFPLYQGTANTFYIDSNVTVALGYIDTTNGSVAKPTNNPLLVNGVRSEGENSYVPEIVFSATPPEGATLSSLVSNGLEFLKTGSIYNAKAYFKAAVTNYPNDTTNDGDTARFFYAITRIDGFNLYSDGDSSGVINNPGDILDRAGCSPGGRNLPIPTMVCPETTLPSDSPIGKELQDFLYNIVIRPELEGALANLNGVQKSFVKPWINPVDNTLYISDYADVLVLKAAIKAALAVIHIQYTYNLDANIANEFNNKANTIQAFLVSNSSFLTLKTGDYSASRNTARNYLIEATDDISAAIDKVNSRNTIDYLINVEATADEIADAKSRLAKAKTALSSNDKQTVFEGEDGIWGTADDMIINVNPFFAGINLRSLLPTFSGDDASGFFPDPTMKGSIIQGINLNADDENSNGIPDILE